MEILKVALPEELLQEMKEFPEKEWEAAVRRFLKQEVRRTLELRKTVAKSRLKEKDAVELADKVNKGLSQRFRQSTKS